MALPQLLNQTVTLYPRASYNAEGREVMGSPTHYPARVQETTASKFLPNGQTITIDAVVYLNGEVTAAANYRVDYNSVQYKVHGVYIARDGQGNANHTKLELIKWKQV